MSKNYKEHMSPLEEAIQETKLISVVTTQELKENIASIGNTGKKSMRNTSRYLKNYVTHYPFRSTIVSLSAGFIAGAIVSESFKNAGTLKSFIGGKNCEERNK